MKNRVLAFLKKYWLCFLLSVIMVIGIIMTARYSDLYQTGSDGDMIRFDLGDLYLIYGLPLYSLIYGCLSYIKAKKIWVPLLILYAINFGYYLSYGIETFAWPGTYIWSSYPIIFSFIGAGITALIYKAIKAIKKA